MSCKVMQPDDYKKELEHALDEAEWKAFQNLSIYKFSNFGYWAAIWVHINRIGHFHRPNPFKCFVDLARVKKEMKKGVET